MGIIQTRRKRGRLGPETHYGASDSEDCTSYQGKQGTMQVDLDVLDFGLGGIDSLAGFLQARQSFPNIGEALPGVLSTP